LKRPASALVRTAKRPSALLKRPAAAAKVLRKKDGPSPPAATLGKPSLGRPEVQGTRASRELPSARSSAASLPAPVLKCATDTVSKASRPSSPPTLMLTDAPERVPRAPVVEVKQGVAVPTSEWRLVPKGVACPRGCEYLMDMSSGMNMVRLLQSGFNSCGKAASSSGGSTALVLAEQPLREKPKLAERLEQHRVAHQQLSLKSHPKSYGQGTASHPVIVLDDSPQKQPQPRQNQTPQTFLKRRSERLHHSRSPPKGTLVPAGTGCVDRPAGISSSSKLVPSTAAAGSKAVRTVHKEKTLNRVATKKDGSREEARVREKTQQLVGGVGREKTTSRREERVQRLSNGRTVVTETFTLRKVTVF